MRVSVILLLTSVIMPLAWAHRYIENDGSHRNAATALPIGDIGLSQVVYHVAKENSLQLWLSFEVEAGVEAKIQLGVPYIERYKGYRPAFALLGPGLPAIEEGVPFEIPDGYGGIVYTTDEIEDPEVFNEEFTGTKSWVFDMQTIVLPQRGLYYIVGFVPSGQPGKYWIAPGTRESFGIADILSLPYVVYKVRTFHEIFPWGGILGWGFIGLILIIIALVLS